MTNTGWFDSSSLYDVRHTLSEMEGNRTPAACILRYAGPCSRVTCSISEIDGKTTPPRQPGKTGIP